MSNSYKRPFNMADLGGDEGMHVPERIPHEPTTPYVPIESLENLDIAGELLEQYNTAKEMLHHAMEDKTIPLNQKAQTVNSITTIIQQIAKTQTDIYNADRIKTLEAILIATLKEFPTIKNKFLEAFDEAIKGQ